MAGHLTMIDKNNGLSYIPIPVYITTHKKLSPEAKEFYVSCLKAYDEKGDSYTFEDCCRWNKCSIEEGEKYKKEFKKHGISL